MSAVKGLSGFIVGLGVGGAALTGVTSFVPQIEELAFLKPAETEQETVAEDTTSVEPVVEVEDPNVSEETPATEETAKEGAPEPEPKQEAEETVEESVTVKEEEVAVVAPEPKEDVLGTEPETVEAETKKPETEQKKIKLPTIEPEQPKEADNAIVEEPAKEQGITIGQKPSSSLPSISPEEPTPEAPAEEEKVVDGNALQFNAVEFEGSDRPLMGVILEDIGAKGLEIEKLKTLNAPITIAVRADAADASERALAYRGAGFEVIAMAPEDRAANLNIALNSNQVNDALNALFTSVPNAIGIIDNPLAKLQKNSRTSGAIIDNFIETGHGLITYAKGLNSVDRSATSKGVLAAKVSRILDANSENKALMARYLDRVSLDAGRDGSTIVLGTTAKDTVAALAGWILSSKGQSVAVAPASAVLLGK